MDFKKFAAVFAVMVMVTTAFAVTVAGAASESDAADDNTIVMIPEINEHFQRLDEKVTFYEGWDKEKGRMYTTEKVDDLFVEYINGRSDDFLKKVVEPEDMKQYYMYVIGYNYRDAVDFYRDSPTYLFMEPGDHTVTLQSDINYLGLKYGWDTIELKYNKESKFKFDYGTSVYVVSQETDFEHLKPVTLRFDDSVNLPVEYKPTQSMTIATKLIWYSGVKELASGSTWDDEVYLFPSGSAGEQKFVDEVIKGKKAVFDRSDYGAVKHGDFPAGTYAVYKSEYVPTYTPKDTYVWLGDAGNFYIPLFQGPSEGYNLFTKPNSSMTIAMDFDDTKYTAFVDAGQFTFQLSPNLKYTIDTTYASEIEVFLEVVDPSVPYAEGDVTIEVSGVETEAGSPTGFAALCIILAALVFVVLFLSNRKPHW